MQIQTNDASVKTGGDFQQYVGLAKMNVIAVNPTKTELEALGYKPKEEPQYINVKVGEDILNKVTVYLKQDDDKAKFSTRLYFFWKDEPLKTAASGKKQFINTVGQYTYADSIEAIQQNENMKWFKTTLPVKVRLSKTGEAILIDFMKAWGNVKNGDNIYFDNFANLVTEMRNLVNTLKDNKVEVLVHVTEKSGKTYQQVYNQFFGKGNLNNLKYFMDHIRDQKERFKPIVHPSLELKEYVPSLTLVSSDTSKSNSEIEEVFSTINSQDTLDF